MSMKLTIDPGETWIRALTAAILDAYDLPMQERAERIYSLVKESHGMMAATITDLTQQLIDINTHQVTITLPIPERGRR